MNMRPLLASAAALAFLISCGGSTNGGPQEALSRGTATWIVLDLNTREFSYLATVPGANTEPEYRTTKMVFRRVRTGGGDLFVSMYELTQQQWDQLGGGPLQPWTEVDDTVCNSAFAYGDDHPAYNLDNRSVMNALAAFTLPSGARLDLPTSDEWTAACGATNGWWWGATTTQAQLNANAVVRESVATYDRLAAGGGMDNGGPLAVGSKAPNRWGLYDMLGNVWEWTREGTEVRGGSWYDGAQNCRAEVKAGVANGVEDWVDYALIGARLVLRP